MVTCIVYENVKHSIETLPFPLCQKPYSYLAMSNYTLPICQMAKILSKCLSGEFRQDLQQLYILLID
jgi:hypothetical protein